MPWRITNQLVGNYASARQVVMGRKRVIDQEEILDAAEAVVVRDGAAHLTLDAVAEQAGISKASVIYDYKSKQALIQAVIERRVANDTALIEELTDSLGDVPSAVIRGRILASSTPPLDDARAVAVNLCAALAQDAELRSGIQKEQANNIASILATSESPRGALLAYLALEGLKILEYLDLHTWPAKERGRILREINWLVDAVPQSSMKRTEVLVP
jgi:AcrR family transcriptional regulator